MGIVSKQGDSGVPSAQVRPSQGHNAQGIALALSGGGYRAMLFHLGSLLRLGELRLLDEIVRISSVSGGSIAAGALAKHWGSPDGDPLAAVRRDLHALASRSIDFRSVVRGLASGVTIAEVLAAQYRRHLFGNITLQDLPERPRFTFNATNFRSGVAMRWSKEYGADYKDGAIFGPRVGLAEIVAASSAFPPFLSPLRLQPPGTLVDFDSKVTKSEQPDRLVLTDGGVYDNYGLEALKQFKTVLVSDGGARFNDRARPPRNWLSQSLRTTAIINSQSRALRARELVDDFERGALSGALWTIATPMSRYTAPGTLHVDPEHLDRLARVSTRLKRLPRLVQRQIVNLGYAQADASIRSNFRPDSPARPVWPYPDAALD